MTTKHEGFTPGPWVAVESGDGRNDGYIREAKERDIGASSGMRVAVARVTTAGREHSEVEANARLIAAAPSLYADNVRLREALAGLLAATPADHSTLQETAWDRARAALKGE